MTFFCSLPFTTVDITKDQKVKPCCKFTQNIPIKSYFSSDAMRKVKQQLLDNIPPPQCQRCVTEEALTGHSMRVMTGLDETRETEIRAANSADYFNITEALILTSNTCNLLCLPCYGSSYIRGVELSKIGLLKQIPLPQTSTICIDNIPNINNLTRVTLLGGEPFADRQTAALVDQLITSGLSRQIQLDLNTNLTLITRPVLLKLKENFKEVLIKGSIDGVGEFNEYLRYPSTWQQITDAVTLIKELDMPLVMTTAMSNLALIHYDDMIRWAEKNNIIDIFVSKVMEPLELRCDRLPAALKQQLLKKYTNLVESYTGTDRTRFLIQTCIEICSTPGCTDEEFTATHAWLTRHDQHRGTDYTALWPEFIND